MAQAPRPSYKCPLCPLVAPTSNYIIEHQLFAHSSIVQRREDALVAELLSSQEDFGSPDDPFHLEVTCDSTPPVTAASMQSSQHEYDQSQHETQGSSSHGGARHLVWSPLGIEVFLQIVETHLAQLNDNKTKKNKVWNKISRELNAKMPDGNFTSDQCRQKWSNFLKGYKKYLDNVNKTGAPPIPKPAYFDLLHGLLRGSHSMAPQNLFESGNKKKVGLVRAEPSAFVPIEEEDLVPDPVPLAGVRRHTKGSTTVAEAGPSASGTEPAGPSAHTKASRTVASDDLSSPGTGRREARTTRAGAGPPIQNTEPARSSTRTEVSTPVAGAGPSRSRRLRITPLSHNAQVRKLLQDVVDQLKDSEACRTRHRELIIKELQRFNDNFESLHKRSRKRRHESDSD